MDLPRNLLISHDDYEDRHDPHVWMNPNLWSRVVLEVRDALTEVHPDGAEVFSANADAYLDELAALAQYTQQVLGTVPAKAGSCLSAHDAFNYFGSAYGFEVTGIQGISTESEAGLQRASPNWSTCWWTATSAPSSSKARSPTATSAP
jgi:manganese/zinc/iron transport system substrate-binding protein